MADSSNVIFGASTTIPEGVTVRGFKLYQKISEQTRAIRQLVRGVVLPIRFADAHQHAGLVRVTLWFDNHDPSALLPFSPSHHIVAEADVEKLVGASLALHYEPGYNPHAGATSPVQYITTEKLMPSGPYWWSVPGLRKNGDPNGAVIWNWGYQERVWIRPGVVVDVPEPEYAE
jgi:hypothetical protein